jgi:DNA polymerase-3 subunit beta
MMHFACERDILLKEIAIAQEIISSRNTLSILSNVLLNCQDNLLTIKATDLKVSFQTHVKVESKAPGSITVFCDKLLGILRSLPEGEIEMKLNENLMVSIRPVFQKIDFNLKSVPSDKYPEIKEIPDNLYFNVPQNDFLDMISKTLFAVSSDETRYFMNGVYLEKVDEELIMVATDGRRLSYISKKVNGSIPEFSGVIIPPKILHLIRKLAPGQGNLSLAVGDNNLFVRFNQHRVSSNLIDAQFPNYKRVIPEKQEYRLVVERDGLQAALRRVSLLVEEKSRRIQLGIEPAILIVNSSEGEIGSATEEVGCEYDGPQMTIAANYMYLLEPLREAAEEKIGLEFTEPDKAITLRPVPEKDYFHIVMPMQVG